MSFFSVAGGAEGGDGDEYCRNTVVHNNNTLSGREIITNGLILSVNNELSPTTIKTLQEDQSAQGLLD